MSYLISYLGYKYYGEVKDQRPAIQVHTPQPKSTGYGGWGSAKGARYYCQYCSKWFTSDRGKLDHERQCKKNPNRTIPHKKKKQTKKTVYPQSGNETVIHHRETIIKEKEIIKERVLLICPNCQRRTEQGHPKCQHCGAPL